MTQADLQHRLGGAVFYIDGGPVAGVSNRPLRTVSQRPIAQGMQIARVR